MQGEYVGLVDLEGTMYIPFIVTDTSDTPAESDALPVGRVYGPNGALTNLSPTATMLDEKTITGATNANPIVVSVASHGFLAGAKVFIRNVGGNTNANGVRTVANPEAGTFELSGGSGNGAYTSGGTVRLNGTYLFTIACTAVNGFESGQNYTLIVSYAISATAKTQKFTFAVA